MNQEVKSSLKSFVLELLVYGALVVGYFFLVLHLMGNWLNDLFHNNPRLYAAAALLLIIGQGVLLEWVTSMLLAFIKPLLEDE